MDTFKRGDIVKFNISGKEITGVLLLKCDYGIWEIAIKDDPISYRVYDFNILNTGKNVFDSKEFCTNLKECEE